MMAVGTWKDTAWREPSGVLQYLSAVGSGWVLGKSYTEQCCTGRGGSLSLGVFQDGGDVALRAVGTLGWGSGRSFAA